MKHIISISGEFNSETLNKFIEDYNNTPDEVTDLHIYLSSFGGESSVSECIVDIIEHSKYHVTLIASDDISSAAFYLFFKSKGDKRILPNTIGMFHMGYIETASVDERGKPKEEVDKAVIQSLKNAKKDTLDFCEKLGMNTTEIGKIKRSKEVYFQYNRLVEFIDNLKKSK